MKDEKEFDLTTKLFLGQLGILLSKIQNEAKHTDRKFASSNRLLMKGIFEPYVL